MAPQVVHPHLALVGLGQIEADGRARIEGIGEGSVPCGAQRRSVVLDTGRVRDLDDLVDVDVSHGTGFQIDDGHVTGASLVGCQVPLAGRHGRVVAAGFAVEDGVIGIVDQGHVAGARIVAATNQQSHAVASDGKAVGLGRAGDRIAQHGARRTAARQGPLVVFLAAVIAVSHQADGGLAPPDGIVAKSGVGQV